SSATDPPHLYTLSLHDALPIYHLAVLRVREVRRVTPGADRVRGRHSHITDAVLIRRWIVLSAMIRSQTASQGRTSAGYPVVDSEDRKSTRLNSSHRTISYAVFC